MTIDPNGFSGRVQRAFRGVAAPSLHEIIDCDLEYWYASDRQERAAFFAGRTWESLEPAELHEHADAFIEFSAKGLHYYLPAFLIAAMEDTEWMPNLYAHVTGGLSRSKHDPDRWLRRMSVFSGDQRRVVREYLEWAARDQLNRSAAEALKDYWDSPSNRDEPLSPLT